MKSSSEHTYNYSALLKKFNNRDNNAFGEIYTLLYNELYHFTSRLYRNTEIVAGDVMHDTFVYIWEHSTQRFDGIENLKAYLYISIKNRFRNYLVHQKSVDKFQCETKNFVSDVVESETLSIINQAINLLPSECAKVFRLHIDGWQVKDIAEKLGKSESTVYAQKQEAISILKKKLPKNLYLFLSII